MDIQASADDANPDIASLLGSRICHDLISPLGAIGNGVELLAMTGVGGPELQLIAESVAAASARIRFFRIAFGAADGAQRIGRAEILSILEELAQGSRVRCDWQVAGDAARGEVKLAFLALLCLEAALPRGGTVRIAATGGHWRAEASGPQVRPDPALWDRLEPGWSGPRPGPAQIQFALLPDEARSRGRMISHGFDNDVLTLTF